jgi:hypothetical protein
MILSRNIKNSARCMFDPAGTPLPVAREPSSGRVTPWQPAPFYMGHPGPPQVDNLPGPHIRSDARRDATKRPISEAASRLAGLWPFSWHAGGQPGGADFQFAAGFSPPRGISSGFVPFGAPVAKPEKFVRPRESHLQGEACPTKKGPISEAASRLDASNDADYCNRQAPPWPRPRKGRSFVSAVSGTIRRRRGLLAS